MAPLGQIHRCTLIFILELVMCIFVKAVRHPGSAPDGESTAGSFGQSITLICNMNGRTNGQQIMWFYVDSESYISRNDRLFPTLDEDRLNRYSAWIEPDFNQYMLRIDGLLIRDGGKYVCGYNDQINTKFVPVWESTLVVFHPPEDNTLACDVTYLDSNPGEDRELEVSCSWNIELLNVDVAMYQGRTILPPDMELNGRMIRRMKGAQFTRLNNFRCLMVHPDQNRQSAQCTLPQREPRPAVHIQPLIKAVPEGTTTEFECQTQNQRRSNIIWTPNCSDSPNLDVCKRITLVNGGIKMRIANPQLGDDGMLIQCSVLSPNGLMAAGVAQINVDAVPSTAADAGLKGGQGRGTDRVAWTNPRERSGTIPAVTTLEAEPFTPTQATIPEAEYSNQSVYATIIPVVVVVVLLLLIGYTCLSKLQTFYKRRKRKEHSDCLDDRLFDQDGSLLSKDRMMDAVRALPKLLYKARRSSSKRGKTAARRPPLPVNTAWASRGSIPRAISPIAITPDLFRTAPMMSTSITSAPVVPPLKPYPRLGPREEAPYQNTGPLRQTEVPRIDPKLIMIRPSKRYDFVRISNDIARGYTNLRPDAAPQRRCSFAEDDFGYLVKSPRRTKRRDVI